MSKNSVYGVTTKILSALGLNAVPAIGFLGLGWGWENTLLLYLLDILTGGLLVVLRIRLLAPAYEDVIGATPPKPLVENSTRKRAAKNIISYTRPIYDGVRYDRNEMLKSYLWLVVVFFVAVGVFVVGFLLLIMRMPLNPEALRSGLVGILTFQLLNLLGDVIWLRGLSLPQAEKLLAQSVGRMGLLNLAVVAGFFAAPFHPYGFLLPFMALKTMVDVGRPLQALYQRWSQTSVVD